MEKIYHGKAEAMVEHCLVLPNNKFGRNKSLRDLLSHFRLQMQGNQLLKIMKLTAILLIGIGLQVNAKVSAQGKVTLSEKNSPIEVVIKSIEKQTGYTFIYEANVVNSLSRITIDVKNATLSQALDICFKDQPVTYNIIEKTIIVKRKFIQQQNSFFQNKFNINIKGKIVDKNGDPIQGVTVQIEGSSKTTTTNEHGEYIIPDVPENSKIIVSSIGYETLVIQTAGRSVINLTLAIKISSLDETIIIAYGKTTKRFSTGNISSIKSDVIEKQPVNNPLLTLSGRVPGLIIRQANGIPGGGVSVRIQGKNSLSKGNDPLYVIDGVPYMSQLLPNIASILGGSDGAVIDGNPPGNGNPLSYINPAEIESIEILKDADATAIYGSRAANGAILITTKKGKAGKTLFDLNVSKGFSEVARKVKLLNLEQYLEMRREAYFINDKYTINSVNYPNQYDINGFWDTTRQTDWQKELIGNTAQYENIDATLSGGSTNTQFNFGTGYRRETTVFPGNYSSKSGSIQLNFNHSSINQKFKLGITTSYLLNKSILPYSDLTISSLQLAPNAPTIYNEDGSFNWMLTPSGASTWANPIAILNSYSNKTNNLISSFNASYKIIDGLQIKANAGYTDMRVNEISKAPQTSIIPDLRPFISRSATYNTGSSASWIIEPQIIYEKNIKKLKFDFLAGSTIQQTNSSSIQLAGTGYNNDLVLDDIKAASSVVVNQSVQSTYKYAAIFTRMNINWKEKYLLNLTARRDGSSRFGSKNRFHNFGAVGAGWIFTSEPFFENNILSFGKLRGSYGTTGSDQIGDYQYLNKYNPISAGVNYQGISTLEVTGIPNPYIAWEETKKLQFGLDLGFLHDKIALTANYVRNRSSNQLLSYKLPIITGFGSLPVINFPATIQNTALEISLTSTNIHNKNFSWATNFNITIPDNKLLSFPGLENSTYATSLVVGKPITIGKRFQFAGVDSATGVYQFIDSKGGVTINPNSTTDRTIIQDGSIKLYGGLQNTFSYKKVELDFLFQFVKQPGANNMFGDPSGAYFNTNQPISVLNRWQKPGDPGPIQRFNSDRKLSSTNATYFSDAAFTDASFVRLKNVFLSWRMGSMLKKGAILHDLQIYIQGQNILTITKYKGLDPENLSLTSVPPLRIITFGIKICL